jgi:hypothetical protein
MPSDLTRFGLADVLRCGNAIRRVGRTAPTMETAAREVCRWLFDELVDRKHERACALVRCYKTHPLGQLPPDLQDVAHGVAGDEVRGRQVKCLTLLGTAGSEPTWNDRHASKGHRAIPLATPSMIEQAPMIAQLLRAFGVDVAQLLASSSGVVKDLGGKSYGVFHVADAEESPYIPAKDFVRKYHIQSVVGCGGALKGGDLFALILFARVPVSAEAAERFRTVALDMTSAFFLYDDDRVFDAADGGRAAQPELRA